MSRRIGALVLLLVLAGCGGGGGGRSVSASTAVGPPVAGSFGSCKFGTAVFK